MSEEQLSFQAEVSRLLDIVAHSLYSNKEIFLRELISNASDACDKLRYLAVTDGDLMKDDPDFRIDLEIDSNANTLTISDNGIGMNRQELIDNLGTIARSGTSAFMEQMESSKDGSNLIGQFGVGFYSSYMVADKVSVTSRRAGEDQGWQWDSDGKGKFTIAEVEKPGRGTSITLHLKEEQKEYSEELRLRTIIKTYSDHIPIPIRLKKAPEKNEDGSIENNGDWETLNSASAIWTRSKSDVTDEQYKEFYHHVAHAYDDPWLREHFRVEGVLEYSGLLYIPGSKPFDLFHPDRKHGVKLYVRRVFITDDCQELIPAYMRFLKGVIDSEDLPLNISREMLQDNPMLRKIRGGIVKRVLGILDKKAENEQEEYLKFWENFGSVLKEGLYEDLPQKDALLKLCRFKSIKTDSWISLADYLENMKEGQEHIYYISGEDEQALRRSPQIEGFKAKDVDVLVLHDPVDEFWVTSVNEYEGKGFKSVTRGGADLNKIDSADDKDDSSKDKEEDKAELGALLGYMKLTLEGEVKDIRSSERLTDSAVCLVADEGDMDIHLERILRSHKQVDEASKRVLEINPKHDLVKRLSDLIKEDGAAKELEDIAWLLLDQARILEGQMPSDAATFAQRMSRVMGKGLS
ncbi:heat shock protein 90 [Kiloniella litopenaei]|uniref:Chaperone protein HtpG n=1 Tax=Kiloniella litopenaei TaxID=1549748 RepID=A0A0M2RC60_9PROT|nr:molecular chaperone HtpG [Kiloniella litopenaei]KKJ78024.1 heat shock protein 90 [Kiloniella litopenaei]